MKQIKVGIIGYFGRGNAGDEAMKDILLSEFPNSIASDNDKINKCDAYIIAGGDLVQEYSGLHMPEIWKSIKNEPCYALSLGVKKGWEKKKEEVINNLTKFRKIYTREKESYQILSRDIKVNGVMPDLVLLADSVPSSKKYPILFNYTDRPWVDPGDQFEDIVSKGNIYPVALSPQEFDTKYTKNVVSYNEFISMAKSSHGVIGTRLHAVVMGAIAGVPLAGIAYEEKVRKFCERYDIPCFEYGLKNGTEIIKSMKVSNIDLEKERKEIKTILDNIKKDITDYFNTK